MVTVLGAVDKKQEWYDLHIIQTDENKKLKHT